MCDVLIVKVKGGYLRADASQDPDYPGIDIEFIADNESADMLSRPRVLFEKPVDGRLRALVWSNPKSEDYDEEIEFSNDGLCVGFNCEKI